MEDSTLFIWLLSDIYTCLSVIKNTVSTVLHFTIMFSLIVVDLYNAASKKVQYEVFPNYYSAYKVVTWTEMFNIPPLDVICT